jgi:hypothetical protein
MDSILDFFKIMEKTCQISLFFPFKRKRQGLVKPLSSMGHASLLQRDILA